MAADRKRSSYSTKSPIRYSQLYQTWRRAAMAGRKEEADRLGAEHTARALGGTLGAE